MERGTAAASRRRDLAVAGKTGTAQNSARQGPRLVHRLRARRQAGADRRRRSWSSPSTAPPWPLRRPDAAALPPRSGHRGHDQGQESCWTRRWLRRTPRRGRSSSTPTPPPRGRGTADSTRHSAGDPIDEDADRRPQLLLVSAGAHRCSACSPCTRRARPTCPPAPRACGTASSSGSASAWSRRGSSSTSRRGCSSGWRRRSTASASCCWCWCCWSAPARAPPRAASSWLSIGGHQIGQPSELAKVATVLMLARYPLEPAGAAPLAAGPAGPGHHRRRAVPPGAQAARPGQRDRVRRDRRSPCCSGRASGRGSCSCWPRRC